VARSKVARAIAHYQKGKSFREIGEILGVSASTARRWVRGKDQIPEPAPSFPLVIVETRDFKRELKSIFDDILRFFVGLFTPPKRT
jgi:transposase-like protein